jgi:hypothetical protein
MYRWRLSRWSSAKRCSQSRVGRWGKPAPSGYRVQSRVPVIHFRLFLEVVKGQDIHIPNENVSALSQLCEEFGFRSRISALEEGDSQ